MNRFLQKQRRWLLPTTLILFALLVVTFPLVAEFTYTGRSESPDHTLTYTTGKLRWDDSTNIDPETGVAELSLFSANYDNVAHVDGVNVIAPGTDGFNVVRLKNDAPGFIYYTATLYTIRSNDELPVKATLTGEGFTDASINPLPKGVDPSCVIRSVTGVLRADQIQDFDVNWVWQFYESDAVDAIDTEMGDLAAAGSENHITVGLYIIVQDETSPDIYYPPTTGDNSLAGVYIALIAVSGLGLLLLLFFGKKRKEEDEEEKCIS